MRVGPDMRMAPYAEWVEFGHFRAVGDYQSQRGRWWEGHHYMEEAFLTQKDSIMNSIKVKLANEIRDISIVIYNKAADYAARKGVIIADTKFEFGMYNDKFILIDEVLTPDSSRFWPKDDYEPGRSQASFDKQFVRDYLDASGWDKVPPVPVLPDAVVAKTQEKYKQVLKILTGEDFYKEIWF